MSTPRQTSSGMSSEPHHHRVIVRAFGQTLRTQRLRRGISQEDLAERANMYRTNISLLECGRRSVRLETICILAAALSIQPSELMPTISLPAWSEPPEPRGKKRPRIPKP